MIFEVVFVSGGAGGGVVILCARCGVLRCGVLVVLVV